MGRNENKAASFKFDRKYEKVYTEVVYESANWAQFLLSYRNRYNRINLERSVAFYRLKKSIGQYGQMNPGLVSSDGVIIKGQTRFTACRALGIPFSYVVSDKTADELMLEMITDGTTVYRWSIIDIVNFYADCPQDAIDTDRKVRGNSFYHLLNLHDTTRIPMRDISNMNTTIGGHKLDEYDSVIRGVMPSFNKSTLGKYLDLLAKLSDKNPFSRSKRIWVAVIGKLYQEYAGDFTKVKAAVKIFLQDMCDEELDLFIAEKDIVGALNKTADSHDFGFCFEASVVKR